MGSVVGMVNVEGTKAAVALEGAVDAAMDATVVLCSCSIHPRGSNMFVDVQASTITVLLAAVCFLEGGEDDEDKEEEEEEEGAEEDRDDDAVGAVDSVDSVDAVDVAFDRLDRLDRVDRVVLVATAVAVAVVVVAAAAEDAVSFVVPRSLLVLKTC